MAADGPASLIDLIEHRAATDPERLAYRFLPDGIEESSRLTFAALQRRATAIGAALQDHGAAGERVLITYPGQNLEEYVTGFAGCLMAGAIAVPCDSPLFRGGAERFARIADDCRPAVVLGRAADADQIEPLIPGARHLDAATVPESAAEQWRRPDVAPSSLALLQYTSGSTRSPRGVRVTHANVLANERAIAETCEHDRDSHFVGWLPLFHDMGMIANVLQPLYLGSQSVLMPPAAFLRDPMRWLSAIHRYRGVAGGGPNFAFDLCVSRVSEEQRATLDLSSWRTAFNGAEVVREATLRRFTRAFGQVGFARESFFSCYGLAEATLIVAGAPRRRPPVVMTADADAERQGVLRPAGPQAASARPVVSSGRVVAGSVVAIVDPRNGRRLASGAVGEVWVSGPGVADGYWGSSTHLDGFDGVVDDDPARRYLRTGDLGAFVDDELYVVGRTKDLIIVRGANHHPSDIEWTIEDSTGDVRPTCVAVFAGTDGTPTPDGGERVVAVCEPASGGVAARMPEVAAAIRAAVARRHGLHVHDVVLAARGTVTKTTSGKVRRSECRTAYAEGRIRVLARSTVDAAAGSAVSAPFPTAADLLESPDATSLLVQAVIAAAGVDVPAGRANEMRVAELGLDSMHAVELQHRLQSTYAAVLRPFSMIGDATLGEICESLLDQLRTENAPPRRLSSAETTGRASLTQTAIVLEQQLAPPGPAYVLTRAVRIRGALKVPALRRAVARVVDRHPALRTTLRFVDGALTVREQPAAPDMLSERPLLGDVRAAVEDEAARGIGIDDERLARFLLLRRAADDWVLVLSAHHAVVDFWSAVILMRELLALYDEESGGAPAKLGTPGPGPAAQAQAELALVRSTEGDALRAYWSDRLSDATETSALPHPRSRPEVRMFHGGTIETRVDRETTARVRALAASSGCTLFTVLFAAFQVLTSRLSGRGDVVVGTFATGRDEPSLAGSVGCLTNLVPVRGSVDPKENALALLAKTRAGLVADLTHSRLPFAEIVRVVAPDRDPARLPVVQAAIVMQQEQGRPDEGMRALALGIEGHLEESPVGLEVDVVGVEQRWTHLDMTLNVAQIDGGLTVVTEYDESLHDRAHTDAVLDQWVTLLSGMAERPEAPVGRLQLLSPRRLADAVTQATGPQVPATPDLLHTLVDRRCASAPDRVAIAMNDEGRNEHLTATSVLRWAATLASRLEAKGVGPGSRVGILLDRCAGLPVAMLAVLRLGAAYVPLDPSDPVERLAWTAADADVAVIVTDAEHLAAAPPACAAVLLEWDDERKTAAARPAYPEPAHTELPAYVIYTSGSTGRQKGVVVPHRAIVNRLLWMQRAMPLQTDDRVLQRTPMTFDVSLWELFWPLIDGATLVMAPPGSHRDPERLAGVIRREQITVMHSVPTALSHLLPHISPRSSTTPALALRRLVSSGEALPSRLRDRFHRSTSAELDNLYGPTEAAVDVTWWTCSRRDAGPVPIGRPIDATEVHVVDRDGLPLPAGAAGEIAIAGAALAHGYSARPGSTAASWLPHPLGGNGARMYRTGDRGMRGADGAIRFLGRLDSQVSLAGRRVEIGEVEEALRSAPGVRDAAVTATDDGDGIRLVGHVVAADVALDRDRVREWLRRRLPPALVPADIRLLPDLPATPNGKLDRAGLVGMGADAPARASRRGPADPLQRRIAQVWCSVLGTEQIGPDDDFFSLGGDSITALRVVAALRSDGLDVPVGDVLANPSVAALARSVAQPRAEHTRAQPPGAFGLCPPGVADVLPAGVVDAYPISSAQLAVLFHQMHGERHEVYVTSLRLRGSFDADRMRAAVQAVSERHPYLRSRFALTLGQEPMQIVHEALAIPMDIVDLRAIPAARGDVLLTSWLQAERTRAFDVERGPLVRLTVHRRDDATWQLTLSSFALDGWATATVITDLLAAHRSGAEAVEAPRSDYRTFVALERAAVDDAAHKAFWATELESARVVRLPSPRPATTPWGVDSEHSATDATTRRIEVPLSASIERSLRRLARQLQVSERTLLLAAHLRVVRALTGNREVLTGVEASGRPEEPDGDRVVGVFNNIVPVRVAVTGSWTDLILATVEAERRIARFRRYPLAQIERDLGRPGLLQTMFVHTNFHLYRDLRERAGVDVEDSWAPDRTYVPLTAHTNVDALTGSVRLLLDVDPADVDEATAHWAAGLYPRAWEAMLRDPDASCTAVPLSDAPTMRRQLHTADGGNAPAGPACALDLVLEQARYFPDRIAVRAGAGQYTYRELALRAHRLGGALREAGVTPDSVVAVPARRSPDLLISVLGIWAAGAAYLPVDPTEPADRVRLTCAAAGVTHAVAHADDRLAGLVESATPPSASQLRSTRRTAGDPRMLAYVLPTSGSTGTPKLVGIPHTALVNYLLWSARSYGAGGRTPVHSPVGFDLTVTSLLGPLVTGGSVDLLPDGAGPEAVGDVVTNVDGLVKITPAHLAAVAGQLRAAGLPAPSVTVVVGGEALTWPQVQAWRDAGGDGTIINEYGPTEATVGCITWAVGPAPTGPDVPVGRPIPGTRARLMDGPDAVHEGVAGELALGGRALARGYVGAPRSTAERFVPDPYGNAERLYMTGDLARRDHDGLLHVLGRLDRQVKVRGRRIEPAATEAAMLAHPEVRAAAVTAVHVVGDRRQLVGYWVSARADAPGADALSAWLRARLPAHQVPDTLMWLPVLPMTPRGKIDLSALPHPREGTAPAIEALIARLSDEDVEALLQRGEAKLA